MPALPEPGGEPVHQDLGSPGKRMREVAPGNEEDAQWVHGFGNDVVRR